MTQKTTIQTIVTALLRIGDGIIVRRTSGTKNYLAFI